MKSKQIILILAAVLSLASCAAHKNLATMEKDFVAQGTLTIRTPKKELSAPARLSVEKEKMMRLQVMMPFLGSEIFRAEFTPDGLLVIDKMNRRYFAESYANLYSMTGIRLDYNRLQRQVVDYLRRQEPLSFPMPGKGTVEMRGEFEKVKPSEEPLQPSSTAKYARIEAEELFNLLMNLR